MDIKDFKKKYSLSSQSKTNQPENSYFDDLDKKRREEERKRLAEESKRAEENRKVQERDAKVKAIISNRPPNAPTLVSDSEIKAASKVYDRTPSPSTVSNIPSGRGRNSDSIKKQREKNYAPYREFSNELDRDFTELMDISKATGKKLNKEDIIPPMDKDIDKRLEKIASKIKPGKEGLLYSIKEGMYEKEIMNMLSKEYVRKMNDLPNNVSKIEKFLEDNPGLQSSDGQWDYERTDRPEWIDRLMKPLENIVISTMSGGMKDNYRDYFETESKNYPKDANILTDTSFWRKSSRGVGDQLQQQTESAIASAPYVATYTTLGFTMGTAFSTPTLGVTAPITSTTGSILGFKYGMSVGAAKHSAMLEAGFAYKELLDQGISHEIAKPIAKGVGAVNGVIEIANIIPGLENVIGLDGVIEKAKKEGIKATTNELKRLGINYVAEVGGEVVEELLQENVGMLGTEIAKVYESEQNPSMYGGFKNYVEKVKTPEWRNIMSDVATETLISMWLTPAAKGIGGAMVSQGARSVLDTKANKQKDHALYTVIPDMIKYADEDIINDDEAIQHFAATKIVLQEGLANKEVTNKDKQQIQTLITDMDSKIGEVEYKAKELDPTVEFLPSNETDIEERLLNEDINDIELYNKNVNEYSIEVYKKAIKHGMLEDIKLGIKEGKSKNEIAESILKRLPNKERSIVNGLVYVNAVDDVMSEIKSQLVMNEFYNINIAKEVLVNNPIEETRADIETVEDLEEPTQANIQEDVLEADIEPTEPTNNIQTEETITNDVGTDVEEYKPSDIVMIPTEQINFDPERFQFRYEQGNERGATRKLEGAEYNPQLAGTILLWQDEYNDLYVVNGHHRVDLARESNVSEVRSEVISYKDYTAEEARALGATINIAEDNASAIDVAKVLRDTNITEEELYKQGVRPKSKIARDGAALSKLNDWIFTQVAVKKLPLERAVIIGRELGDNKEGQNQFIRTISQLEAKGKTITNDVMVEMLAEVKGTAQETFTEQTLFGAETMTKNYSVERAELVSYVKGQLKERVSVLKNVSKEKNASLLEELGNKIAIDDNVKEMNQADQALWIIDKTLNYQGTKTNELFNNLARDYSNADPQNKMKVKKKALSQLISMMEGGNLLNETIRVGTKEQRKSIERVRQEIESDGEGQQEFGLGNIQSEETKGQVDLFGDDTLKQLKESGSIKVTVNKGTELWTKRDIMPIIKAMESNVFFNGLEIEFTGEESVRYWTREELDNAKYYNNKPGEYQIAGRFETPSQRGLDNSGHTSETGGGKIYLNNGATKDTILHEVIHFLQYRMGNINPDLAALIDAWETDIRTEAKEKGKAIPEGKELLVHALVHGEFGYAKDNPIGDLIAVDNDIVEDMKAILGDEVIRLSFGKDMAITREERTLRSEYDGYAERTLTKGGLSIKEAKEKRATEMRKELNNGNQNIYYSSDSTTYGIVTPKDTKVQVSYFNEYGLITDEMFDNVDDAVNKLIDSKVFYGKDEVHYQLKQFTRETVDDMYQQLSIFADKNVEISDSKMSEINADARIGNFTADDFDNLILDNGNVQNGTKIALVQRIMEAVDKGLDTNNSEVNLRQYLNRFYGLPVHARSSDKLYNKTLNVRYSPEKNKIEVGLASFTSGKTDVTKPGATNITLGNREFTLYSEFDNLEDAISYYKSELFLFDEEDIDTAILQAVRSKFIYTVDMLKDAKGITRAAAEKQIFDDIKDDYNNFRDNIETYRHKGLDYDFDLKPHYNISYQLKDGILNEEDSKYWNFPNTRGELTVEKVERYLRDAINPRSFNRVVDAIESPEILKERLFWHGTGNSISKRLKPGFMIPEGQRGGGYGEIQHTISLSKSKKAASNFSNTSRTISIYPIVIQEGAKIIDRPDIQDAIELEDELLDLWKDKVDAIAIGDWEKQSSEKELVILNPRILSTVGKGEYHQVYGLKVDEPTMEEITTMWENSKKAIEEYNSNKTKINYQLKAATDTQEFKNWFKDSKVVDSEGNPLVVYHGTIQPFDIFKYGDIGFHFGNLEQAEMRVEGENDPKIIESYLRINNPIVIDKDLMNWNTSYRLKDELLVMGIISEAEYSQINTHNYEGYNNKPNTTLRSILLNKGYDGIIYENWMETEGQSYIAFNPTQIKSIYNQGTFNEYDPNINYQLKESINNVDHYELEYGSSIYNNFIKDGIETNLVYKTEEQNGLSTLLVDMAVEDKDIHDMVIRDTVLGGYDYLKMGDNEPTLITNQMIEEVMTNGQPLFQLKEESGMNGSLLAMHNIDKNKLKNAIKLGGFPMPSIAVAKKDLQYTDFGNITLLFDKDTIDPQASKLNKVYSGDAYTPVFPTVYNKINEDVSRKLNNMVYDRVPSELRDSFGTMLDEDNISNKIDRWGSFKDAYSNDVGLMIAYLNEKDIPFEKATTNKEYGGWEYELLDILVEKFPVMTQERYIDMNVADEIAFELTDVINDFYKEAYPDFTLFQETMEFGQVDRLAREVYEYATDENRTIIDRNETEKNIKNAINEDNFSNWLEEISEGIIEKTGFRNNKDMFTPSGNRRKWETLHEEVTLDNVVRAMKQEPDQAAAGSSGIGQFMAVNSQEFKSLQHIRDSIDMLVDLDPEEFKELREEYSNRLFNIANKIKNPRVSNQFMALDSATDILIENIRDYKTKSGIIKALRTDEKSGYISLSNFSESELFDLIDDVKEMPTQYFEAKPRRAVRFNEVQAALIDESRLSGEEELTEIKDMLKSVGVNVVETYSEDNRQQAIDSVLRQNDVSFQLKETDTTTPEFKKWFKDSKVVDDEGNPMVVYHGSPEYGFTEFKSFPAYFSPIENIANIYESNSASMLRPGSSGTTPGTYQVYLKMERPFDTRLPEVREIFYKEYYRKYGTGTDLMMSGLPDWTDGEDIYEFIQEQGYDFDGIVLDEGGMGGYNDEVVTRGVSYLAFNSNQIKSVNNQGTWDVNDANIHYQLKEEPDLEERSWGQTIRDAGLTTPWLTELLTSNKFMYEVKHNEDTLIAAAKLIDTKGEEYIEARLLSDLDNDAVLMAASQIMTYKFMEDGEQDRAMSMLDKTAEKATSLGQAIQILSVWGRQTPEGMLRYTSRKFKDTMTDKDKQMVIDKTKTLVDEFNKLNRVAINDIDLVGTVEMVRNIPTDERAARDIASKGGELPEGGFTTDMLEPFSNTISDDMTQKIIDTVNKHYQDGKGNLKNKLSNLGINDFEVEILDKYIKQQIKDATRGDKQALIDNKLSKKKYERVGIDQKILDATADGVDESVLRNLVGEKEGMPTLTKELVDYIYQQGQYINSLEPGRQRDVETAKMIATISDHMPVSFWTKVNTFQTIAQLLNFRTTISNLVGNEMFKRLDTFTLNFLGTPIDIALAKASGGTRTMLFRPISANKAQKLGYKEGWRLGLEDALLGINTSDSNTQYELRSNRVFKSGILGEAEKVLNIALRATDRAAVMATFRDILEEQMQIANVDVASEEMVNTAMQVALYRTFQDDTVLSSMFSGLKKNLNKIGSKDGEFGLGELIMKYPKTSANILGRAIDYSPVGLVVTMLKLARDTSGDATFKRRTTAEGISRAVMGTGLIATGALLARMGVLTGSNPDDDEDIYKLQKQYGLRDYSVNVSAIGRHIISGFTDSNAGELKKGDKIASYDWAEPIAMGLAIGADTELGSGEAMDLFSTIVRALETGTTALADQPLLTGLANLFRYGDPVQGMTQVIKSMPSSFTPTLFSHVAQFVDGRDTDPYSFYGTGKQAWNLVANRIPGLRNKLPGRQSVLGDEKRYYPEGNNLVVRAANIFLNPSITSSYMPSEEAELLFDLYNATSDADVVPRPPQKVYTIDKVKYTFTPESWEEMSKWLGNEYKDMIGNAENYMKGWSAEEQADEIKWIIKEVKERAKEKVLKIGTKID